MPQRIRTDGPRDMPRHSANVDQFATISGVQIFKTGVWNGKSYSTKSLDQIVAAAAVQGYRPPVKLGHTEEPGAPAYGYAVNLRRDGDTLLADFENVPDELVEQIRKKRFDAISSEIYFDLKRDKTTLPLALRAVAVLGAHPPAVGGMKSLSDSLAALTEATKFAVVDFAADPPDEDDPEPEPEPPPPEPTPQVEPEPQPVGDPVEEDTAPKQSPTPRHPNPAFKSGAYSAATPRPRPAPSPKPVPSPSTPPPSHPSGHFTEQDPMTVQHAGSSPANTENSQAELLALQARVSELQLQAQTAQAAAQAASTSQLTIQRLQEQVAHSANALKMIGEQRRQERIDNLVSSVVRPAWRNHIRALADLGTRGEQMDGSEPQTVIFQAQGADEAGPTPALAVLEDLVRLLNADVAHLFSEQVKRGDIPRQMHSGVDDPSAQLFSLINDYCRAHPGTDPDVARRAVLSDPKHTDIVRRWNMISGAN